MCLQLCLCIYILIQSFVTGNKAVYFLALYRCGGKLDFFKVS